jgi:hypothetical protein
MIATLATNINSLFCKKALVTRANEELDTQRDDLFNVSGNKSLPNVKFLFYDDSFRCNLCCNQKKSIKGKRKALPKDRDSTTLEKLCFYSMEIQCMERFKDKLSKDAKVLKE